MALLFLLGVAGLAIDIGRMYIAKSEAQAYVDSAALAAAMQLDGTAGGITRAATAVSMDTTKWRFDTTAFNSVTTQFSDAATGTFVSTPTDPTTYYFARVVANVNLPMYLIRVFVGPTSQISAGAVAGRSPLTSLPGGVFPFSPYIRKGYSGAVPDNTNDPYGYQVGNQYTLRWGAPGDRTNCGTDGDEPSLSQNGQVRGYCCVSQSAADLRASIVGADTDTVAVGQPIPMENGAKNTEMSAIGLRSEIDTDNSSTTYAAYKADGTGNGARVVVVAVNNGPPNYINMGFAGFFLLPESTYHGLNGNESACAEYIGAWTEGVRFPPTGGAGAFRVRLFQ